MKKLFCLTLFIAFGLTFSGQPADPEECALSSSRVDASPAGARMSVPQAIPPDAVRRANDISDFIAALSCSDPSLKALEATDVWSAYRDYIDRHWAQLESERLKPIRSWADSALSRANDQTRLLFYPFGGPDFQTAFQFFPEADTYILLGLEPVGNLPEIESWKPEHMKSYLEDMEISLSDFFSKSYFITRDMDLNLQSDKLDGVLPLICFFLKRSRNDILDIKRIEFDDDGNALESSYRTVFKRPHRPYGIKIVYFTHEFRRRESVYYFSCDLSDEHFDENSKFYLYLNRVERMSVLVKSASYLLHFKNFSNIRKLILSRSQFILEDDTGVPYRYFRKGGWKVQLFGEYSEPVKDFSGVEQPDLKAAYLHTNDIGELPFHLGYHWGTKRDCLLLVEKQ
jgi:hypothetical protein